MSEAIESIGAQLRGAEARYSEAKATAAQMCKAYDAARSAEREAKNDMCRLSVLFADEVAKLAGVKTEDGAYEVSSKVLSIFRRLREQP